MTDKRWSEKAIALFVSYAREDEALRDKLATHLKLMERQGIIESWSDRQILPGTDWQGQIAHQLETAQIILLLISSDFLASDYCYDVELKRAMERHKAGAARVIPILLRPVDNLKGMPFGHLRALPKDDKPVTQWSEPDEAFVNIAQGIRAVVESWQPRNSGGTSQSAGTTTAIAPPPSSSVPTAAPLMTMAQTNTGNSTGFQVQVSGGTVYFNAPGQQQTGASNQGQAAEPSTPAGSQGRSQADQDLIDSLRQQQQGIKRQLDAVSDALLGASAAEEIRLEAQRDSLAKKLKSIEQRRQALGDKQGDFRF